MIALRAVVVALGLALLAASPATAATIHGLVYEDTNGDGQPSAGEPGVAGAVVAFGVAVFAVTDSSGQFDLTFPDVPGGIAWVRVPDGFAPGPVWARWDAKQPMDLDLPLRRLPPSNAPLTFIVAADTHIAVTQEHVTAADLATAAINATALDPAPAFFTILGDITQGNRDAEFDLVDGALGGLGVPFVPVPGNHDWYDGGTAWFAHYGPDNYSFDHSGVHFVVWNMAMQEAAIRVYLGAELARVPSTMPVVALTHAPPSESVVAVLRELGVDYVLTGHAHSNRAVDHGGLIELNTEPFLMGALDFTPAGYRVITIDGGQLSSYHRTTVDDPQLAIVTPAVGTCMPATGSTLVVAAEIDAGAQRIHARLDCGTPLELRPAGGWNWRVELPGLQPGRHLIDVETLTVTGMRLSQTRTFEVCAQSPAPPAGAEWPQLGGGPSHEGMRAHEIAPPLASRWTAAVGGHVITASPVIAGGTVYIAVSDLADGDTGGVVALDLVTGAQRWRVPTPRPVRGGLAVAGATIVASQIDGVVLGLDASTGALRWRHELGVGIAAEAGALYAPPAVDEGDVLVGHQRALAVLSDTGAVLWTADPVPVGRDSQTAAALAIGEGLVVGTFERALGGVIAWDRRSGSRQWSLIDGTTVAINASPVIANDTIYIVSGADEVTALDLAGEARWRVKLDSDGFDWGNATIGTPALGDGVLVVPTLYRDLVGLDATTGMELWRHAGEPGPLRTTHYRGGREAGFAASPVITGSIVWAVDTSGVLSALELHSGEPLWRISLDVPVLAGLAVSGDWLVVASYDGTVRALAPTAERPVLRDAPTCRDAAAESGCCQTGHTRTGLGSMVSTLMLALVVVVLQRRRPRQRRWLSRDS